jgi:hypothetical protein
MLRGRRETSYMFNQPFPRLKARDSQQAVRLRPELPGPGLDPVGAFPDPVPHNRPEPLRMPLARPVGGRRARHRGVRPSRLHRPREAQPTRLGPVGLAIARACLLKDAFHPARRAFLEILDEYSLDHFLERRPDLVPCWRRLAASRPRSGTRGPGRGSGAWSVIRQIASSASGLRAPSRKAGAVDRAAEGRLEPLIVARFPRFRHGCYPGIELKAGGGRPADSGR